MDAVQDFGRVRRLFGEKSVRSGQIIVFAGI
jgi:hypothetical protein